MAIILRYGTRWARNLENIAALKGVDAGDPVGVYVLCDGSMPVYVGQGRIWKRVRQHSRGRKAGYWDHFSWFAVKGSSQAEEIEALLLRMLPFYLRSLNKQRAGFAKARKCQEVNRNPIFIKMAKLGVARKRRR